MSSMQTLAASTGEVRVGLVRLDRIRFHPHNVRTDLGDLRELAGSIKRFGVMQPVVAEVYGDALRLRAGHRRVAAARIAGLTRVPAVIHAEPILDDAEWICQAVHENTRRADMDVADRRRAAEALRRLGCSWAGIAETFGVSRGQVRGWAGAPASGPGPRHARQPPNYLSQARKILVERHRAELEQIAAELAEADVDEVVVLRAMSGERIAATSAERRIVAQRWRASGRSLAELDRVQGWNIRRDLRRASLNTPMPPNSSPPHT